MAGVAGLFPAIVFSTIPVTTYLCAKASDKLVSTNDLIAFIPAFVVLLTHYILLYVAYKNVKTWH